MSNWPSVPLGEICTFKGGGTPSRRDESLFRGSIPWATVKDFKSDVISETQESITEEAVSGSATNIIPAQTVLIVTRVGLGKVALTGTSMAINQDIKALFPKEPCDPKFIYWAVASNSETLIKAGVGATVKGITLDVLANLEIPLPPLEEQQRIVALLDRAADIRRRAEAARDKARAIIPALFVDMFGDPATNSMGWDVVELGEVLEAITGGKNLQAGTGANQLSILKVSAVTSGTLKPEESKPAPNDYTPPLGHFVRKGDFLFTRANTAELVGATTIVDSDPENLLLPDKIWRISWRDDVVRPAYMLAYMQGAFFRRSMSVIASGTSDSMKNISQAKLRTLPVIIPPIKMQNEFEQLSRASSSLINVFDNATWKAINTQTALSAEVFA